MGRPLLALTRTHTHTGSVIGKALDPGPVFHCWAYSLDRPRCRETPFRDHGCQVNPPTAALRRGLKRLRRS